MLKVTSRGAVPVMAPEASRGSVLKTAAGGWFPVVDCLFDFLKQHIQIFHCVKILHWNKQDMEVMIFQVLC